MRPWSPIPNALILDARARRIREGRPACEVLALAELLALDAQRQEQTQQGVAVPPVSLRVVAADLGWGRGRLKAALEAYSALGHAFAWIGADQSRTTCGPVADQSRTSEVRQERQESDRPGPLADHLRTSCGPVADHPGPDQATEDTAKAQVAAAVSPGPRARARALPQAEIEIEIDTPPKGPPHPAAPGGVEEELEGEVIAARPQAPPPAQLVLTELVAVAELVSPEQQALDVLNRVRGELEPARSGRRPRAMELEPREKEVRRAVRELRGRYGRAWLEVLERTARWVYGQAWCAEGRGPANPLDTLLRPSHTLRYAESAQEDVVTGPVTTGTGPVTSDVGFGQFGAQPRRRW